MAKSVSGQSLKGDAQMQLSGSEDMGRVERGVPSRRPGHHRVHFTRQHCCLVDDVLAPVTGVPGMRFCTTRPVDRWGTSAGVICSHRLVPMLRRAAEFSNLDGLNLPKKDV